jgi:DNA-nicking Smr family endonuclease|tara:strand:- start:126 stop:548 length:423 start_codon:yes stop_codon:yes gene_type:complete
LNSKISDKDKKDWKNFISSKDEISNKDLKITKDKIKKKIIKKIDLHGFSLENANKVIEEFITQSFEEGVNKIIVITGKGLRSKNDENPYISKNLSILKYSVPEFIKSNINLMKIIKNINEADIEDGGKGAFYIYLKNFKE